MSSSPSSSSRRIRNSSSSSSVSGRQPKWRNSRLSAQPATSISKVFAQPLQGSPLRSAIDTVAGLDLDDAASVYSEASTLRKRERCPSVASDATHTQDTSVDDAGFKQTSVLTPAVSKEDELEGGAKRDILTAGSDVLSSPDSNLSMAAAPVPQESPTLPSTPIPVETPSSMAPVPAAADTTTPSTSPPRVLSRPKSTSWFGSRSRARESSVLLDGTTQSNPISSNSQPITDKVVSTSPQSMAVALPSTSPPPQSEPPMAARPASSPTESVVTPVVSPIDDEIPPHEPVDKGSIGRGQELMRKASLSALNPSASSVSSLNPSSSSRFMLRIPLLGRPKIPLDQAVAQAASEDIRSSSSSQTKSQPIDPAPEAGVSEQPPASVPEVVVSLPSTSSLATSADGDILSNVASASNASTLVKSSSQDDIGSEQPAETISAPHHDRPEGQVSPGTADSSWWGYLGWSSSAPNITANGANAQSDADRVDSKDNTPPQADVPILAAKSDPALPISAEDTTRRRSTSDSAPPSKSDVPPPAVVSKRHSSEISRAEVKEIHVPEEKNPTPSVFSADTAKSQGSAWYSPWSWYASSPIVPSSSSMAPQASGSDDTLDVQEPTHEKTASERVKEQALARDDAAATPADIQPPPETGAPSVQAGSGQPETPPSPSPQPSNPIESSISVNRAGWASFFMSKALLMKNITDGTDEKKQDANGMEVMDIDDDDEGEGAAAGAQEATRRDPIPIPIQAIAIVAGKKKQPPPSSSSPSSPKAQDPPPPPREREPKKSGPPAPPLTNSESIKEKTVKAASVRAPSPTPSKASATSPRAQPPNLVLPTWNDTFLTPPRSNVPPTPTPVQTQKGTIGKTLSFMSGVLFHGKDGSDGERKAKAKGKGKEREREEPSPFLHYGRELPKALEVLGQSFDSATMNEKCRVVVIGVAGWSPGAVTRTLAGGLPSSSSKFVSMACSALEKFEDEHGFKFAKITQIPLEGDGTIERKVAKVHAHLLGNEDWVSDLHAADVIFVATHSQGSIVSTHLLDQLIREGHILTERNLDILTRTAAAIAPAGVSPSHVRSRTQKVCCLALCGIHLGPLRYLRTSSLLQPYIQYFENAAARELFDFQNTESEVSRSYVKALQTVMDHGTKMVYVASLNDQVVPIYSGIFAAASHPRILRALYIDGDAYHSSDFLSNLLVLLIRILNSGLSDSGLLTHLSEATAGTLSGVGHSTAYEELATYSLAVNYLFQATDGGDDHSALTVEPFNAVDEQNDYEIPWSLRDLIADDRVAHFFAREFAQLKDAFDEWSPKTSILRDIKRKLQPIQRLSSIKTIQLGSRL